MKLIFCGTPRFAVPSLERLIGSGFDIALVVTNPDEPRGRGYGLEPPPVKTAALRSSLRVFQPAGLKDASVEREISSVRPDAIVVVAYGHILPRWMIELPPLGCINLHASLLPAYRGAAPIQWAIINGETLTGVTAMKIDQGLDTGDILMQETVPIASDDTAATLSPRLSDVGAGLIAETLRRLERNAIEARPQDHQRATFAPMLKKEDGHLDWSASAAEIERRVRGLIPWPGAYTRFRGKSLGIWKARPAEVENCLGPGELKLYGARLLAGCGGGALELLEVQLEGRRRMVARDFANGMRLRPGEGLGA
ncbi:MAG: methionyl-tRNA formyltransferase [Terriglobia bacterium]